MMGTVVYEMILKKKKKNEDSNNKIRRTLSNPDVSKIDTINLTELCGKVDSLSISQSNEEEDQWFDSSDRGPFAAHKCSHRVLQGPRAVRLSPRCRPPSGGQLHYYYPSCHWHHRDGGCGAHRPSSLGTSARDQA